MIKPCLLTLESWDDEEKYVSSMPWVPPFSNREVEAFFDKFWGQNFPQDYGRKIKITRELERGVSIHAHITLPDVEAHTAYRFEERLEHFIDEELSLIEHGY